MNTTPHFDELSPEQKAERISIGANGRYHPDTESNDPMTAAVAQVLDAALHWKYHPLGGSDFALKQAISRYEEIIARLER